MTNKHKLSAILLTLVLFGIQCSACMPEDVNESAGFQEEMKRQQAARKAEEEMVRVSVLQLRGGEGDVVLSFPTNQFTAVPGDHACPATHYDFSRDVLLVNGEKVVFSLHPVVNQTMPNPDPNGCDFGRVSEVRREVIDVPQHYLDEYKGPTVTPVPGTTNTEIRTKDGGNLIGQ